MNEVERLRRLRRDVGELKFDGSESQYTFREKSLYNSGISSVIALIDKQITELGQPA